MRVILHRHRLSALLAACIAMAGLAVLSLFGPGIRLEEKAPAPTPVSIPPGSVSDRVAVPTEVLSTGGNRIELYCSTPPCIRTFSRDRETDMMYFPDAQKIVFRRDRNGEARISIDGGNVACALVEIRSVPDNGNPLTLVYVLGERLEILRGIYGHIWLSYDEEKENYRLQACNHLMDYGTSCTDSASIELALKDGELVKVMDAMPDRDYLRELRRDLSRTYMIGQEETMSQADLEVARLYYSGNKSGARKLFNYFYRGGHKKHWSYVISQVESFPTWPVCKSFEAVSERGLRGCR
ncbi:MAG: hypothetical protein IPM23_12155 [Candidatus Melainabacteria bacterium]|nr:hypothetical protein [Candidatus Melainabacteria bacterium]